MIIAYCQDNLRLRQIQIRQRQCKAASMRFKILLMLYEQATTICPFLALFYDFSEITYLLLTSTYSIALSENSLKYWDY